MMIFSGSFFGMAHGIFLPVMMVIFGDTIELLSDSTRLMVAANNTMNMTNATNATPTTMPVTTIDPLAGLVDKMGTQAVQFCGLGVGALFTTWIQVCILVVRHTVIMF